MNQLPSLSIVIPCHNEAEVIEKTWHTLKTLIGRWEGHILSGHELVIVNNGSTDASLVYIFHTHPL